MFEKEKLSGNNFNDWFARLKLVLRVEKKMHVIEQPLPPAPEAGAEPNIVAQWTALYDAHTEIACLMLGTGVEKFDLIQSFHACKQEEGKSVADYVLKMKGYVEQLERLGYMLPQDISVGLILNGLTKDFVGFVRNYNMHNMGKTIGEIHAMLIEYEKGLPKKIWCDLENLTTLPLSFWDYALESATRILNMVPTKKVDKIPYELWDLNEKETPLYKAAIVRIQKYNKWIDAMNEEIQSNDGQYGMGPGRTFLPGCKTVGSRWIFKKKDDMDVLYSYKASLVAKGYINSTGSIWCNLKVLLILIIPGKYASFKDPFMVLSKHQEAGIKDLMRKSKVIDDIIIMGNHIPSLQSVKDYLGKCFAMKDLGEAAFILGIKIYRDRSKRLIGLCQNAYMDKILKRYKMDNSKRGHIPMQERLDLNKSQGAQTPKEVNRMKNVPYASAVGSIMYAVRCTRPDVAFAQNMTSRFQQNPGEPHWTAVKNILKCIRSAMEAVWISEIYLRAWYCSIVMNTFEYVLANNSAAVHYVNEPRVQRGARHYHRRYHYVCESVVLGKIRILKVHTDNNLADPFTKALSNRKLTQHARGMGLRPAKKVEVQLHVNPPLVVETAKFRDRAESIRTEREHLEALAKAEEQITAEKAKNELKEYESDIKRIQSEIAAIKLEAETKKIAAMRKEMSWQPAERDLFTDRECNLLHEKFGKKEWPFCTTMIRKRTFAPFVKS
ncbi:retrotransposon protein, putative, ty1-copia subclass [Tanacetum coccineum]|uniref:Retrotransposon protein, putative, ty1-copia subclass n=1 Tax=Tanacetum coccineum TaxID=301880 RepID=A0ABQ4ZRU3_9ASTR